MNRTNLMAGLPVIAVGGMVALALIGAMVGGGGHDAMPEQGRAVATRDLRFEDRADGAVLIYDVGAKTPFDVVQGEAGFLRGTLRGLARTRHSEGLDDSVPFHLAAWPDGRLTLDDPATGRRLDLEAFGSTNEAVFSRLLPSLTKIAGGPA